MSAVLVFLVIAGILMFLYSRIYPRIYASKVGRSVSQDAAAQGIIAAPDITLEAGEMLVNNYLKEHPGLSLNVYEDIDGFFFVSFTQKADYHQVADLISFLTCLGARWCNYTGFVGWYKLPSEQADRFGVKTDAPLFMYVSNAELVPGVVYYKVKEGPVYRHEIAKDCAEIVPGRKMMYNPCPVDLKKLASVTPKVHTFNPEEKAD